MTIQKLILFLIIPAFLSGCVIKKQILVSDQDEVDSINQAVMNGTAIVTLDNGDVYLAQSLVVAEDSTWFQGRRRRSSGEFALLAFSTDQLKTIRLRKYKPQPGKGLLYGAITGVAFGAIVFLADPDPPCTDYIWPFNSCLGNAAFISGLLAVGTGGIGGVIGLTRTEVKVYRFE